MNIEEIRNNIENREIKFREWDVKNEEMTDYITLPFSGDSPLNSQINGIKDDNVLMQFTGYKDETGKEIYIGDIIETNLGRGVVIEWAGVYSVEFISPIAGRLDRLWLSDVCLKIKEIIGNIYENEDLIKNK